MKVFLQVATVSGNGATIIFLEDLLTLSNVYEKVKTFETIESRKPRGNAGLKSSLFCINIPDKCLQALNNFLY